MFTLLAFLLACAPTPCDRIDQALEARLQQCDILTAGEEPVDTDLTTAPVCTIGDEIADCLVSCYRDAPCGALDGTSTADITTFQTCTNGCAAL